MPMICSAEMLAAISEAPMAHQGGQEVVGGVLLVPALVAGNPLGQAEDGDGVDRQDDEIYGLHGVPPPRDCCCFGC
jgi:hypothetical protein